MPPSDDRAAPTGSPTSESGARRNSALVAAGIAVSRLTGLVRERAVGHYFGTSYVADAFTAAFRIPNMMQHLLGEGVLSASFIPVYSRLLAEGRREEAGKVAGAIVGLLTVVVGVLSLIGILLAEPLTTVIAAGFLDRPETFDLTVTLVRILFPSVGFMVLSSWCLGILNSHRRFFLSYVAPALANIAQVIALITAGWFVFDDEIASTGLVPDVQESLVLWLAVGTIVGGFAQFAVQVPTVLRLETNLRPSLRRDLPGVRTVIRNFVPVVGARGVVQISAFVHVFMASFLAVGALATLRYAQILYLLPISLFGMSVAAAELPDLSVADRTATDGARRRIDSGLGRVATFVVPTVVGYLTVGDLIVGTLFRTGAFDRVDAVAVWIVLGGYTIGLLATTSSRLLQSVLYGRGDTRTPARISVARVAVSLSVGALLMFPFDRFAATATSIERATDLAPGTDAVRLGAAGLTVAAAFAAWLEYALLRRSVGRTIGDVTFGGDQFGAIVVAAVVAGAVAVATRPLVSELPALAAGVVAVAIIGVVYGGLGYALGVRDIRAVVRR